MRKRLVGLLALATLATAAAYFTKGTLPDCKQILPELLQEPAQTPTEHAPFSFEYAGNTYHVEPLAAYELWGLVVSHNDIGSFLDLVHDSSSVDTKDVAVIWGENLQSNDFRNVRFWNTDTWVHWR